MLIVPLQSLCYQMQSEALGITLGRCNLTAAGMWTADSHDIDSRLSLTSISPVLLYTFPVDRQQSHRELTQQP